MADDWGLLDPLGVDADVTSDDAVLTALVDVERALVLAWGDVLGDDASGVAATLDAAGLDRADLLRGARAGGVPVIPLVAQLRAQAEAVEAGSGAQVHAGATSQDILDTAIVLVAQRSLAVARRELIVAGGALAALADEHRATLVVARTLGQHAAQSTAGVTIAGWLDGVVSAIETLDSVTFPVQLGGAVGTGEAFDSRLDDPEATPRLRAALAARLGLADPVRSWHTERTAVLRIADAAAIVAAGAGRIGHDVAFLARTEVAEVVLASTGGSSAMPHKHNPVDAVLLTANGLRAPGLLATVHAAAVSQDARPAGEWHAEWQALRGLVRLAVESAAAASALLGGLSYDGAAAARIRDLTPELTHDTGRTLAASDRIVDAAIDRFRAIDTQENP